MTVKEIIEKYLKENGFDGLFNSDGECGCLLDDFMPCDSGGVQDCEPGYKKPGGEDSEFDWVVGPKEETT